MREVFRRHRGSQKTAASELGISASTLSLYLDGQVTSQRLDALVPLIARRLEESESTVVTE